MPCRLGAHSGMSLAAAAVVVAVAAVAVVGQNHGTAVAAVRDVAPKNSTEILEHKFMNRALVDLHLQWLMGVMLLVLTRNRVARVDRVTLSRNLLK